MADPTYGYCTGLVGFRIDNGFCEDVRLDDLTVLGTFYFPRAIHHGQGVFQPIIDERADEAQRNALFYILSGEDQPSVRCFRSSQSLSRRLRIRYSLTSTSTGIW